MILLPTAEAIPAPFGALLRLRPGPLDRTPPSEPDATASVGGSRASKEENEEKRSR